MFIESEIHKNYTELVSTETTNLEDESTASSLIPPSFTKNELEKLQVQYGVAYQVLVLRWHGPSLYALKNEPGHVCKFCGTGRSWVI